MTNFLFYRRPAHVDGPATPPTTSVYFTNVSPIAHSGRPSLAHTAESSESKPGSSTVSLEKLESVSTVKTPAGIPEALSFDNIINGGTCPPCTARDFLEYLTYVTHASENLRFYLWARDYAKRFSEAATSDVNLAPEWTETHRSKAIKEINQVMTAKLKSTNPEVERIWQKVLAESPDEWIGTAHEAAAKSISSDPFATPPGSANYSDEMLKRPGSESRTLSETATFVDGIRSYQEVAMDLFKEAGLQLPFTVQPFRDEINRIVATYLSRKSSFQLNISSREKDILLHALAVTTHPSAFTYVMKEVEKDIRRQLHPNFIRWTIRNGNKPRVIFARGLGVFCIVGGIVLATILTLSKLGRGWRALPAILWVLGFSTLFAAIKGMCVVLHGFHHRQLHPWEYFSSEVEADAELRHNSLDSMDTLVSFNSYEDAPWVQKYEKKNLIRKIFDREVWIKEPALRQIQDKIFLQSVLMSLVLAGILCAIFIPLPAGGYF